MNDLWRTIKGWAHAIGDLQARLLLSILYAVLVVPTGLILKLGGDALDSRYPSSATTFWKVRSTGEAQMRPARRQG